MKTLKTVLLAGVLASVGTMAFAQAGAPTAGVDFRLVYGSNATANGNASYARTGRHVRTGGNRATIRQGETTGSGYRGVSSPD
jgi:hypothetical protein